PPGGDVLTAVGDPAAALEGMLRQMIELGASDLHLSPGQPTRIRLDGDLSPFGTETPTAERTRELLRTVTPEAKLAEFDADADADFGHEIPGLARFRVNLFRDRHGMGAVFRQIPESIPSADDLGLPQPVRDLASLPKGLVLVTGPTGSGKSTTLAAIVDLVNRTRPDHVITIEDPVEFVHPSKRCMINQREVGEHTRSFARALRAALREDPDVVLVGEMRDLETTSIAIETAETGHLVFATLHTTSAVATIERLVNQYPADRQEQVRLMLADSLKAVVSQTLLKRVGGGRVAAQEILLVNRAVSNLIRENKSFQILSIMQTSRNRGNVTLNEALMRLVKEGTVEPREAWAKAVDRDDLLNRYRAEGIDAGFLEPRGEPSLT
ncbi:MAG: type IV pilus twitching motility protein PilT, partial [Thermoanaerobaculia bacterium]